MPVLSGKDWNSADPRPPTERSPLLVVIVAFVVMLMVSLVWGWVLLFGREVSDDFVLGGTIALEVVDTIIALAAWVWMGRLRVPKARPGVRVAAWVTGPFALAVVLGVNVGYHAILENYIHDGRLKEVSDLPEWSWISVLVFAVQPAIVEEFFFRYVAYGAMRTVSGTHAAVWVSAVMFAIAHIYNPLGLPWLLVAGVVFGYCRVASGGLALPMLLHFAHNAAVLWFEGL